MYVSDEIVPAVGHRCAPDQFEARMRGWGGPIGES